MHPLLRIGQAHSGGDYFDTLNIVQTRFGGNRLQHGVTISAQTFLVIKSLHNLNAYLHTDDVDHWVAM